MRVFIGYDSREQEAWDVCAYSMRQHSSIPLEIEPISLAHEAITRPYRREGVQLYDGIDGQPFSTEFSFARFLVPHLMGYEGWALFCDCDFLWRGDLAELWEQRDEDRAIQVVPHRYRPERGVKMDGVIQAPYERKNWSSMVLWNCGHRAHSIVNLYRGLDLQKINAYPGFFLHTFQWLAMEEIGMLGEEWNWLAGHSDAQIDPKAVHFTEGGPWLEQYADAPYADEWRAAKRDLEREAA